MLIVKLNPIQFQMWATGDREALRAQIRTLLPGKDVQLRTSYGRIVDRVGPENTLLLGGSVAHVEEATPEIAQSEGPGLYDYNTGTRVRDANRLDIEQYLKSQERGEDYKVNGKYYFIKDEEIAEWRKAEALAEEAENRVNLYDFNSHDLVRPAEDFEVELGLKAIEEGRDFKLQGRYYALNEDELTRWQQRKLETKTGATTSESLGL